MLLQKFLGVASAERSGRRMRYKGHSPTSLGQERPRRWLCAGDQSVNEGVRRGEDPR